MFAPFNNGDEAVKNRDYIVDKMPKKHRFDLMVFIGRLEQTYLERIGRINKRNQEEMEELERSFRENY